MGVLPCAAVASVTPATRKNVQPTIPHRRPSLQSGQTLARRHNRSPITAQSKEQHLPVSSAGELVRLRKRTPKISPIKIELLSRVDISVVSACGYSFFSTVFMYPRGQLLFRPGTVLPPRKGSAQLTGDLDVVPVREERHPGNHDRDDLGPMPLLRRPLNLVEGYSRERSEPIGRSPVDIEVEIFLLVLRHAVVSWTLFWSGQVMYEHRPLIPLTTAQMHHERAVRVVAIAISLFFSFACQSPLNNTNNASKRSRALERAQVV